MADGAAAGVDKEGIEVGKVGEIVYQIVDQAHVEVNVYTGELGPFADEDFLVGEIGAEKQRDTEDYRKYYADNQTGRSL